MVLHRRLSHEMACCPAFVASALTSSGLVFVNPQLAGDPDKDQTPEYGSWLLAEGHIVRDITCRAAHAGNSVALPMSSN